MPAGTTKRIAAGAYDALIEALSAVFWNKPPFQRFLRIELRDCPELLAGLDFEQTKRQVASELGMRLAAQESNYQPVTLALMLKLAELEDFPNLRQQVDRDTLIAVAQAAVADLRRWTATYSEIADAQERLRNDDAEQAAREAQRRNFEGVLGQLRDQFMALHGESDYSARGRILEGLLNELFVLCDLSPRKSFSIGGEQLDGAFTFNTDDYLLEAKWEKDPASREDVDVLSMKVQRKSKNTLGLFLAINGFSHHAEEAHSNCGTGLIFMDGADLFAVLDNHISLADLLDAKRRHLSQTGRPLLTAAEILA